MAQQRQGTANNGRPDLTLPAWSSVEAGEHFANESTMMPLFFLDRFNPCTFIFVAYRMPVTSIGIRCCQLTRVSELKDLDQLFAVVFCGH
jgi:hypothetical protein